jgi:rhodanese-related sulfurtransferase
MVQHNENLYNLPQLQDFHIDGVKHIHPNDAFAKIKAGEAFLLDVREKNEVSLEEADIPDTLFHPMSVIMDRLDVIPVTKPVYVLSTGGIQSTKVVNLLNRQGHKSAANIDGGLMVWKAFGLPFTSNIGSPGCCGCSCSGCN